MNYYKRISPVYRNGRQKICWLVLFGIMTMVNTGCKKFLETTPQDFVSPTNYYSNKSELISALAGVYSPLGNDRVYGELLSIQAQCVTDEGYTAYDVNNDVGLNIHNYTNNKMNDFWRQCYMGIERANVLLENAHKATDVDAKTLASIMAEAKFMRGYYHFLLAQYFGSVPVKTTASKDPNQTSFPRAETEKEVYDQILKDMTEAEPDLDPINSAELKSTSSRVSKSAAQGILARVCLKMAGYPLNEPTKYKDALEWATQVKTSYPHTLLTSKDTLSVVNLRGVPVWYAAANNNPAYFNNGYAQVFLNEMTNRYDVRESIWEVDYFIQGVSATKTSNIGVQIGLGGNDPVFGNSGPVINAQQYLYNKYAPGDLRRDWAIAPYSNNGSGGRNFFNGSAGSAGQILNRSVGKWRREYEPIGAGYTVKPSGSQINFPILRYSDVLLMICEAEFMQNGATVIALDAINQVRRRAFGKDPAVTDATVDLTAAQLTLAEIQDERARELCFEAVRKLDLIRWGIYLPRLQEVINFNNTSGFPTGNRARANLSAQNTLAGGTKFLLWPIPSSEILANNAITQNPGY